MSSRLLATVGPSLGRLFWEASVAMPGRLALDVDGRQLTYAALAQAAARIARVVLDAEPTTPRLGAVFAARSETAYAGVLGTLLAGAGYVPLNPKFPAPRNSHMLSVSNAATLVVGDECVALLDDVLARVERALLVIVPGVVDPAPLAARHPRHRFVGTVELAARPPVDAPAPVDPAEIAYLLFTSGSTGTPKGVMVSHANVLAFVDAIWRRYDITPDDRFSQTFDLTFDLSAFDLFASWGRGASVHCVPAKALMLPDDFVRAHELTVWFSVPSVGMMMRDLRRLAPGAFPSLRWSLFCGERLPAEVAAAWQAAAPGSVVENLYGPTEATIACTVYRWGPHGLDDSVDGTVLIGRPLPGMAAAIVDDALHLQPAGERGELCVKGPQVSHGYWQDDAKTQDRFVAMPWHAGPDNRWYRTGDLAYVNAAGELVHCGRNDDQIKLRGFRIELAEVEHAIRRAAGTSFVVVLAYPADERGPQGLTAVVAGSAVAEDDILARVADSLPDYMVPGRVVALAELPLNANGKIDRKAVLARLVEQDGP